MPYPLYRKRLPAYRASESGSAAAYAAEAELPSCPPEAVEKQVADVMSCFDENGISSVVKESLLVFTENYNDTDSALSELERICKSEKVSKCFEEFSFLVNFLKEAGFGKYIKIDFYIRQIFIQKII